MRRIKLILYALEIIWLLFQTVILELVGWLVYPTPRTFFDKIITWIVDLAERIAQRLAELDKLIK